MENKEMFTTDTLMNEILDYIPKIFDNTKLLKYHLSFMRFSADMEWFNIASVLYQYQKAEMVKTTTAWRKYLCKPDLYPKHGQSGNIVFLPILERNKICWKRVKVFDISQMQTNIVPTYCSYLQNTVHKVNEKYFEKAEKNWQVQLILNALKQQSAYKSLSKTEINFIVCCVVASCGDALKIPVEDLKKINLNCPENVDRVFLYKTIKNVIEELPSQVTNFASVMENREKEINKINEAYLVRTRGLIKNIEHAKEVLNNKLQKINDSETIQKNEEKEEEINLLSEEIHVLDNAGRNEHEIIQEQQIWKGDV